MRTLIGPLVLAALSALPTAAQDASSVLGAARGVVPSDKLSIAYFNPTAYDASELAESAAGLFGGEIRVTAEPNAGEAGGEVSLPHFVVLRNTIAVRDLPDAAERIVKMLRQLDETEKEHLDQEAKRAAQQAAAETQQQLDAQQREIELRGEIADTTVEVRPRYVSIETIVSALAPFERQVSFCSNGRIAWSTQNVSQVPDAHMLVLCDSKDRIEQMQKLVDQIDRPQPQALVSVTLIRASDKNDPNLPKELVENLRRLIPYDSFEPISTGVLRCSLATGQQCELTMDLEEKGQANFNFIPAAFNPDTRELTLTQCIFNLQLGPDRPNAPASTHSFTTNLTFQSGQYIVVGAVGLRSVFVVLRAELIGNNS
jgi:hypothetical protein